MGNCSDSTFNGNMVTSSWKTYWKITSWWFIAEPSTNIPAALLQNSIKVTSGPARGTKANFMRALALFNDGTMSKR
ncbi:MAG: hypothetical protein Ta2E_09020 [Mycoplasmoidaceae bacterium]|nr:MAG: hypothetical protein Ta2E_09020 [Mycoplasmoidaceae bacterium]